MNDRLWRRAKVARKREVTQMTASGDPDVNFVRIDLEVSCILDK